MRSWLLQPLQAREGLPLPADVDGDTHERGRPYPGGTPVGGVPKEGSRHGRVERRQFHARLKGDGYARHEV